MSQGPDQSRALHDGTGLDRHPLGSAFIWRVVLVIGLICLTGLLFWLLWSSIHVWLAAFVGVLVALVLTTLTEWVRGRTGLSHAWALTAVVVGLLAAAALTGWLLADPIATQFRELVDQLPHAVGTLRERLEASDLGRRLPNGQAILQQLVSGSGGAVTRLAGVFSNTFESLAMILVVIFVGLYLAADPDLYVRGLVALFPVPARPAVRQLLGELGVTLRQWLLGQLVSMVAVGVMTGVGLKLLGIPLPLALGMLAGGLDFIPLLGPIVSAIPAVLFGFLVSPLTALWVVLVFVVVNQIESHLLIPLIQRYVVSLPPVLTVVGLVVFGTVWGLLGLLLAAPITAVLVLMVRRVFVERILEAKPIENAEEN